MNDNTQEIFDFLRKELKGVVGVPYIDYLERKYKKQRGDQNNRNEYQDKVMFISKQCDELQEENSRQKAEVERLTKAGEELQYKLECLLCHSTGSKLSKSTYSLRTMEMYVNDYIQECCEEAQAEAITEFEKKLLEELRTCEIDEFYDSVIKIAKQMKEGVNNEG